LAGTFTGRLESLDRSNTITGVPGSLTADLAAAREICAVVEGLIEGRGCAALALRGRREDQLLHRARTSATHGGRQLPAGVGLTTSGAWRHDHGC
jgi:hypothetical protein